MNLKAFLANKNQTIRSFAELLGCNPHYLSRVMHLKVRPSKRLAKDIYLATGGIINYMETEK